MPNARGIAAKVLLQVKKDAAFAASALRTELNKHIQLSRDERALCTQLVYGVLRTETVLEKKLSSYIPKGTKKLHPHVYVHLLLAAYQIHYLDRVPTFAAVHEAVSLVSAVQGKKVGGFVNAVLRKCSREKKLDDEGKRKAYLEAFPPWLKAELLRSLGEDEASLFEHSLVSSVETPPPTCLRVFRPYTAPLVLDHLLSLKDDPSSPFYGSVFQLELSQISPLALRLWGENPENLPGYGKQFVIQEEGSQRVAMALGVTPQHLVLDACAGHGQKTALLAAQEPKQLDVCDLHASKLAKLRSHLNSYGLLVHDCFHVDLSYGTGHIKKAWYDRVLVDAPCSGIGTLRRRPDLFLRRNQHGQHDMEPFRALQLRILGNVSSTVKVGGFLLYAVCSILRQECEDVVNHFLETHLSFRLHPFLDTDTDKLAKGRPMFRLLPSQHGCDGYFLAHFRREF